jgi:hypothetical protein
MQTYLSDKMHPFEVISKKDIWKNFESLKFNVCLLITFFLPFLVDSKNFGHQECNFFKLLLKIQENVFSKQL